MKRQRITQPDYRPPGLCKNAPGIGQGKVRDFGIVENAGNVVVNELMVYCAAIDCGSRARDDDVGKPGRGPFAFYCDKVSLSEMFYILGRRNNSLRETANCSSVPKFRPSFYCGAVVPVKTAVTGGLVP